MDTPFRGEDSKGAEDAKDSKGAEDAKDSKGEGGRPFGNMGGASMIKPI